MIIGFDKNTPLDFMPAYNNNRKSDKPCIVKLRFVPYSMVQHYSRILQGRLKGVTDDMEAGDIGRKLQREQFLASVISVSGYQMNGEGITDPSIFYDNADTELVIEIVRAMESASKLTAGQIKNSLPLFAGT